MDGITTSEAISADRTKDEIEVYVVIAICEGDKQICGFFNTKPEAETYIGIEQTQFDTEGWEFRTKRIVIDVGDYSAGL